MSFSSKISDLAQQKISAREKMVYRCILKDNVIDRVITPVSTIKNSSGYTTVYSHMKKTYEYDGDLSGMSVQDIDPTKLTFIATKPMQSTSSSDDNISYTVSVLEDSGYILI